MDFLYAYRVNSNLRLSHVQSEHSRQAKGQERPAGDPALSTNKASLRTVWSDQVMGHHRPTISPYPWRSGIKGKGRIKIGK